MTTNGVAVIKTTTYTYRLKAGGTITKTRYDYADGSKSFKWPPGTKMSDVALYNGERLKEMYPDDPWVLVEGEKTADALVHRGIVAVCLPGGSGQRDLSALDELAAYPDHNGHISADNDAVGLKAATAWSEYLKRIHPTVKWVPPVVETPGGDFADLLADFSDDEDADARFAVLNRLFTALPGPPGPTPVEVPSEYGTALRVWEMGEPGPRTWIVNGIIPDKWPSLLFGDGGVGKSTIATHLCLHICTGLDWFGHQVTKRNTLFIDAELDDEEFRRRLWPLSRGMGMESPPPGIFYWRMTRALSHTGMQESLLRQIKENDIGFAVVDSLTIATHLSDQNASGDLLTVLFTLQQWGIPFQFLDHHAKGMRGADPDQVSVYGSTFKHNAVRSELYLQGGANGAMMLHPKKHNFSSRWEPIALAVEFSGVWPKEAIAYKKLAANDPRAVAMRSRGDRAETMDAVRDLSESVDDKAVPTKTVASYLGIGEEAARKRLERLRAEGQVKRTGRGLWSIYADDPGPDETGQ